MDAPVTLPISETFVSIQGEGALAGVPSWFARTSGCNLRCRWCDTPYASWDAKTDGVGGGTRTIDDLVREALASGVVHAVLTGGEPMMFPGIKDLCDALRARGLHVTIETAGTILPPGGVVCDLISISPKLASSTPASDPRDPAGAWARRHDERRLNIPVLQTLVDTHAQRQLKFVYCTDADVPEIESLLGRLTGVQPCDVLLMPEGVRVPGQSIQRRVVDLCVARGWRYCPRLHVEVFGNVRGT